MPALEGVSTLTATGENPDWLERPPAFMAGTLCKK